MSNTLTYEFWTDLLGYEDFYSVSNLGNIKSKFRRIRRSRGGTQKMTPRILKKITTGAGYHSVSLSVYGNVKKIYVHRAVLSSFEKNKVEIVDHINGIKTDNRLCNLRNCTQRENLTFSNFNRKKELPFGVYLNSNKYKKRFRARIKINNKLVDLGSYFTAEEASIEYKKAALKIKITKNGN